MGSERSRPNAHGEGRLTLPQRPLRHPLCEHCEMICLSDRNACTAAVDGIEIEVDVGKLVTPARLSLGEGPATDQ